MAGRKTRNKNQRGQTQPRPASVSPQRPKPSTPQSSAPNNPSPGGQKSRVFPAGADAAARSLSTVGGWFALPPPLLAAALCLLVAVSYFPATGAGFVWDDAVLSGARAIHDWSGLAQIWLDPYALDPYEGHYWPLLYTTFWLEHKLWGLNPLGYHLVNLLLHAAVTLLLWRLLLRLAVPGAWFAAALFAVHPLHVESVVWVIGRKDVLATLFYLASVFTYLRFVEGQRRAHYILALALFVLGLLCKSIVVTLPVSLLIWHWWKQGRVRVADLTKTLPFFLLGLAIALADWSFYKGREAVFFDYSLLERALLAARVLGFYVDKLLWPTELAVIYPRWEVSVGDWLAWGCALGGVAVLMLLWFARHRIGRGPLAGALFFAVALVPTLGFVDFGFMQFSYVADRYQYLAGIGVIATLVGAAAHGLSRWTDARTARAIAAAAVLLLAVPATLTWQHAGIYRNDGTLFTHVIAHNPQARSAHLNLGNWLHGQGRVEEALAAYRIERAQRPEYIWPHIALGIVVEQLGRLEEAEEHYRDALRLNPRLPKGLHHLAALRIKQRRYREAVKLFRTLIEIDPGAGQPHFGLGVALANLNRLNEALQSFDRALALDPSLQEARLNRARVLKALQGESE